MPALEDSQSATQPLDIIVIGAGFAGLYALYRFRDVLGLRVRVFEKGDGVGGVWFWNRYPGARCDSESFVYSYSFSSELEQEWTWSRKFPEQPEIVDYLNHVADRFDLRRDIQLSTHVVSAAYDEISASWTIETDSGERFEAPYLVTAVGCLSATNLPDIPGRDSFAGEAYHTGEWPRDSVSLQGSRVALIGTGSSGIQVTPVVAPQAEHLTVYQRTPNFTVPAQNRSLGPAESAEIKRNAAGIRKKQLESYSGQPYDNIHRNTFDVSDEERERIFEELWAEGGIRFQQGSFADIMLDQRANHAAAEFVRAKIRGLVKDPETAEKLCPTNHPFGSKRSPIEDDYYVTFNRDNVELIDLEADPIVEIVPTGICTESGLHEHDVIVFATGFDAMTGALLRMDIRGIGGRTLADKWSAGPRTYLGLQTAGFPNLFMITGPGSPSVLVNVPTAIEQHVDWISDCIEYMREHGYRSIEAETEAEDAWVEHGNDIASKTLFYDAKSWYLGVNVPGKPRVFMPYCGGQRRYKKKCDESAAAGYKGFRLSA